MANMINNILFHNLGKLGGPGIKLPKLYQIHKCKQLNLFGMRSSSTSSRTYSFDKFGRSLALNLAAKLWANQIKAHHKDAFGILFLHRDYCGHGLAWRTDPTALTLGVVYDGHLCGDVLKTWSLDEKEAFIDWIAEQSDFTLSGVDPASAAFYSSDPWNQGNQRITKARIQSFLESNV